MKDWKVETSGDLDELVERHQGLLSGDVIIGVVDAIPAKFQYDPRVELLRAVVFYHLQHKAGEEAKWSEAFDRFNRVETVGTSALSRFYIYNYRFLAARKARLGPSTLSGSFAHAGEAAQEIDAPLKNQLLGFLLYNYARYLLEIPKPQSALSYYIQAAGYRVLWYQHFRDTCADAAALKMAATQVWKMRKDFEGLFPGEDINQWCGVSVELFNEVTPLADPNFSAIKPT